jgi:hypothetical protein
VVKLVVSGVLYSLDSGVGTFGEDAVDAKEMVEYGMVSGHEESFDNDDELTGTSFGSQALDEKHHTRDNLHSTSPERMSVCALLRSHAKWYVVPALLSFVADCLMVAMLKGQNTVHTQRYMSAGLVLVVPVASALLHAADKMPNKHEWCASILLLAGVLVCTSAEGQTATQTPAQTGLATDVVWVLPAAALTGASVATRETMYTSPKWAHHGFHSQNVLIFGFRCLFLLAALPAGVAATWGASEVGLIFLTVIDGLSLPYVLRREAGSLVYLVLISVATAVFALPAAPHAGDACAKNTDSGGRKCVQGSVAEFAILWASAVAVIAVAAVLLQRERSVRVMVGGRHRPRLSQVEDLP